MKARYTCTLYHAKKLVIIIWVASFVLALPIIRGQVNECFSFSSLLISFSLYVLVIYTLGSMQQEKRQGLPVNFAMYASG